MGTIQKSRYKSSRLIYLICGFAALGLGTAGIFLPIIPTVPLYLLASFCFTKSSTRYEKWLKNTRIYKERVYFFDKHRAITLKSQISILLFVSSVLALTCLIAGKIAVTIVLPVSSAIQYAYFILKVRIVTQEELEKLKAMDEEKP